MFKRLLAITVIFLFLVGSVLAFDKTPGQFREFEGWTSGGDKYINLEGQWVDITVLGHAEGLYPQWDNKYQLYFKRATGIFSQGGSGYHLGGGWIVTAAHVVIPKYMEIQTSNYMFYHTDIDRIINIEYGIGNSAFGHAIGRLVWYDEDKDLALLWVDPKVSPILKNNNYATEWTVSDGGNLLQPGDVIATIVKVRDENGARLWHYEVRYGKIVSPQVVLPKGVPSIVLPWFNMYDFTMELAIYPGDSGSPVFAFINGRPVIIGVARAFSQCIDPITGEIYRYSYASRIDTIRRKMLERQ